MSDSITSGDVVVQVFKHQADAERAVARLRASGFGDVRVSERGGTTTESHVDEAAGLTEIDFDTMLVNAGFPRDEAARIVKAVADGATLVTVVAGTRSDDAAAVLDGETRAVAVRPLDAATAAPATAAAAIPPLPAAVPSLARPMPTVAAATPATAALNPTAESAAPLGDAPSAHSRVVPIREEVLDVTKEVEQTEARIRREVVTEQRTIVVPVQREQLVIERDGAPDVRVPMEDVPPNA